MAVALEEPQRAQLSPGRSQKWETNAPLFQYRDQTSQVSNTNPPSKVKNSSKCPNIWLRTALQSQLPPPCLNRVLFKTFQCYSPALCAAGLQHRATIGEATLLQIAPRKQTYLTIVCHRAAAHAPGPKSTDADKIKNGCAQRSHSTTGTALPAIKIYIKNARITLPRARHAKRKDDSNFGKIPKREAGSSGAAQNTHPDCGWLIYTIKQIHAAGRPDARPSPGARHGPPAGPRPAVPERRARYLPAGAPGCGAAAASRSSSTRRRSEAVILGARGVEAGWEIKTPTRGISSVFRRPRRAVGSRRGLRRRTAGEGRRLRCYSLAAARPHGSAAPGRTPAVAAEPGRVAPLRERRRAAARLGNALISHAASRYRRSSRVGKETYPDGRRRLRQLSLTAAPRAARLWGLGAEPAAARRRAPPPSRARGRSAARRRPLRSLRGGYGRPPAHPPAASRLRSPAPAATPPPAAPTEVGRGAAGARPLLGGPDARPRSAELLPPRRRTALPLLFLLSAPRAASAPARPASLGSERGRAQPCPRGGERLGSSAPPAPSPTPGWPARGGPAPPPSRALRRPRAAEPAASPRLAPPPARRHQRPRLAPDTKGTRSNRRPGAPRATPRAPPPPRPWP